MSSPFVCYDQNVCHTSQYEHDTASKVKLYALHLASPYLSIRHAPYLKTKLTSLFASHTQTIETLIERPVEWQEVCDIRQQLPRQLAPSQPQGRPCMSTSICSLIKCIP